MTLFTVQIDLRPCYTCGAYVEAAKLGGHEAHHVSINNRLTALAVMEADIADAKQGLQAINDAIAVAQAERDKLEAAERDAIITEPLMGVGAAGIPLRDLEDIAREDVPF